jgi:prevent-host-death family protein
MTIARRFVPISYLKTNTADVAKELKDDAGTIVVTQNGVPAFVCINFEDYYRTQETHALLKIVALGDKEEAEGRVTPLAEADDFMRKAIFGARGGRKATAT